MPESLLFWACSPVTARKAIAQLHRVASQIPTEENLKCVQVLDLYSDFYNWEGTSARS